MGFLEWRADGSYVRLVIGLLHSLLALLETGNDGLLLARGISIAGY